MGSKEKRLLLWICSWDFNRSAPVCSKLFRENSLLLR